MTAPYSLPVLPVDPVQGTAPTLDVIPGDGLMGAGEGVMSGLLLTPHLSSTGESLERGAEVVEGVVAGDTPLG